MTEGDKAVSEIGPVAIRGFMYVPLHAWVLVCKECGEQSPVITADPNIEGQTWAGDHWRANHALPPVETP